MNKNLRPVEDRVCPRCGGTFTPKIGGYNAIYCSRSCKARVRKLRNPEAYKKRRARSYLQTKKHPDRLEAHRKSGRKSANKNRKWLANYKLSIGCVDCGYKEHYAALQLDHEGKKSVEISHARSSIARLQTEIEAGKCKVRCANCHAVRTWERKQPKKRVRLQLSS